MKTKTMLLRIFSILLIGCLLIPLGTASLATDPNGTELHIYGTEYPNGDQLIAVSWRTEEGSIAEVYKNGFLLQRAVLNARDYTIYCEVYDSAQAGKEPDIYNCMEYSVIQKYLEDSEQKIPEGYLAAAEANMHYASKDLISDDVSEAPDHPALNAESRLIYGTEYPNGDQLIDVSWRTEEGSIAEVYKNGFLFQRAMLTARDYTIYCEVYDSAQAGKEPEIYNCMEYNCVTRYLEDSQQKIPEEFLAEAEANMHYASDNLNADNYAATNTVITNEANPDDTNSRFADVLGHWAKDDIMWGYNSGYFQGTSHSTFSPNNTMERADLVTCLYRVAGSPDVSGTNPFTDVSDQAYYAEPVIWAYTNNIIEGTSGTTVNPRGDLTRQDVACVLYRFAGYLGKSTSATGDITQFHDYTDVSGYAVTAMEWAVGHGIILGQQGGNLMPKKNVTRAELVVMLHRLMDM